MAKDTAKKNIIKNQSRLRIFNIITLVINVLWLAYILLLDFENWSVFQIILYFSFWATQEYFALKSLKGAGEPKYDEGGNLSECIDLSEPDQLGILSYCQDWLWVCWILQILTQFVARFFWFLYLVIPGYGVYKGWNTFIQPMLSMRQQAEAAQQAGTSDENLPMDAKSRLARKRDELKTKGAGNSNKNK